MAGSVDSVSRRVCVGTEPGLRGAVLGFPGLVLSPVPDSAAPWPRPALLPLHWQPRERRGLPGRRVSKLRIRANSNQSASSGGSGGDRRRAAERRAPRRGPRGAPPPRPARPPSRSRDRSGRGVPEPARPRPRLGGPGAARAGRCRAAAAVAPPGAGDHGHRRVYAGRAAVGR